MHGRPNRAPTTTSARTMFWVASGLVVFALMAILGLSAGGKEQSEGETRGETARGNRLAQESSPYLRLHARNPVNWYPWGEEALAKARREQKPIFLSVGYSTCYWCHVMERESFSDPEIAELLSQDFVAIKVDREERPDVDEIYMAATQLLTGRGGWPNSVFLTPDLKPFYAGTYFPIDDQQGRVGFRSVLVGIADAWQQRRGQVEDQAERLSQAMAAALEGRGRAQEETEGQSMPGPELASQALQSLQQRFDAVHGGFGNAPKFPSPANLLLLMDVLENPEALPVGAQSVPATKPDGQKPQQQEPGREVVEQMLRTTLSSMARGGIYDHLGGGFHRYATDRAWKVPHFEKMLYDNGLLLEIYARWYQLSGEREAAAVVAGTADFLAREMTDPQGAFWSAIDAETEQREGAFYVWTRPQLDAALGVEGAAFLAPILGYAGEPFFEEHDYVLHLPRSLEQQAQHLGLDLTSLQRRLTPQLQRLLAMRNERPRPLTDDKILTDWNGLTIGGLAAAAQAMDRSDYLQQSMRAASFVLDELQEHGSLQHVWRQGKARISAFLADYAYLVHGLLNLYEASGETRWLQSARDLASEQSRRLGRPDGGYFHAAENPHLLFRPQEVVDGARPAAGAVATINLLRLAQHSGDGSYRESARRSLIQAAPALLANAAGARTWGLALRRYHRASQAADPVALGSSEPGAEPGDGRPSDPLSELARSVVKATLSRAATVEAGEGSEVGTDTQQVPTAEHLPITVQLEVAEGWHVNANPASDRWLVPTSLQWPEGTLSAVRYPSPQALQLSQNGQEIAVWSENVALHATLNGPLPDKVRLVLTYQACDASRCLRPVRRELMLQP